MKVSLRLLLVISIFVAWKSQAQQLHKTWEIGAMVGQSGYLGDLNKSDFFSKEPKLSGGLLARYHYSRNLTLRGALTFGSLWGSDANFSDRKDRGFRTRSPLTDLSGIIEWDFLGKRRYKYDTTAFQVRFRRTLSPYLFTGVGVGFTKPKPDFTGTTATPANFRQGAMQDLSTGYSNTHFVIPFGVGVRYDLSENWTLGLEAGFRLAFSDYLDGVSKAANPSRNDRYKLSGLTITYRINNKDKDRDGILDKDDACPTEPGAVKMKGCPDRDNDGVADKDDDCPGLFGLAALKGCPDADGDGIADKNDECPNEYGALALKGCPDKDKDGIADKDDACPDAAGVAALGGCPDKDKDGIADKDDACPDAAGVAALGGCPDKDSDGIADKDDACPDAAGKIELKGCPDTDNDGIADKDDACPSVAGVALFSGCPDTDRDSVEDAKDRCPELAGKPQFEGCPDQKTLTAVIKEAEKKAKLEAKSATKQPVKMNETQKVAEIQISPILFEVGKAQIQAQYIETLNNVAETMAKNPNYTLKIIGYTDEMGDPKSNQKLSEARAAACFDYLLKKGVNAGRMSFVGYGEQFPKIPNADAQSRQQNRRVEINAYRN